MNPNTPTMAYNQQQQQPQQYIVAGQMINIGNQVLEQQQQFVTVDPNAMGSSVGKIDIYWIRILAELFDLFHIFSQISYSNFQHNLKYNRLQGNP